MIYILTLECPGKNVNLDLDLVTRLINFEFCHNVFSLEEIKIRINSNWILNFHNSVEIISIIPKLSHKYLTLEEELKDKEILEKINLINNL